MPKEVLRGSEPDLEQVDPYFCKNLLDHLRDGVYFVDRDRRISYWNKGAERISGYGRAEVLSHFCGDNLLAHTSDAGEALCFSNCPLAKTLIDGQPRDEQLYLRHKDGYRVPVQVRVGPIRSPSGEIIGAVELFSENSSNLAAVQRARELQELAFSDPLLRVGNRRCTDMTLAKHLNEFQACGAPFAVLFIDIDRFKSINDAHGHDAGDTVLQATAKALKYNLRSFDFLGRWGGEEFVVILDRAEAEEARNVAERCRALVQSSGVSWSATTLRATISVGATCVREGDTLATLIRRADQLLYRSKRRGRNRVSFG